MGLRSSQHSSRRCRGDPLGSPLQSSSMKHAAAGKEGKAALRSVGIAAELLAALAAFVLYLATLARAGSSTPAISRGINPYEHRCRA